MKYLIDHTTFGFTGILDIICTVLAAAILVGTIIYSVRKINKMKKEKEELGDKLATLNAGEAVISEELNRVAQDVQPEGNNG